jgi:hypothetical protein
MPGAGPFAPRILQPDVIRMNLYLMEIDIGAPILVVGACHRGSGALIIS